MDFQSKSNFVKFLAFLFFLEVPAISCTNSTSGQTLIDNNDSHDPFKNICHWHSGEYYRELSLKFVCCANDTLKLPEELVHDQHSNEVFKECSKKFKDDNQSDFPTGMWKAFICKLEKSSAFKEKGKFTFADLMNFITKFYPEKVKQSLKTETSKCSKIESEKLEDHDRVQKYMECYYESENKVCHKPYEAVDSVEEDIKKTKQLGCPVVPGLGFQSSIEYCCKKRSTPYPILEFPGTIFDPKTKEKILLCRESFADRERELMPEAFKVSTPRSDDDEDHQVYTTWNTLCTSACYMEQRNYTKDMLKLDANKAIEFYVHDFGSSMQKSIKSIIERRLNKEKIFLAMDLDSENSKPMTFAELKSKFEKASEKEKIQYFCKFVDTMAFEERRGLHEYCFDGKYGTEWGDQHHSYFVH